MYSIDNWTYYQNYITAVLNFQQPAECMDYLNDIINTSEKKVRAPYLARLELLKRAYVEGDLQHNVQSVDLMQQYFAQFGDKACVVGDLRLYLNLLTFENKLELLKKVREIRKVKYFLYMCNSIRF